MGIIKKNIIKMVNKFGLVEELNYKVNSKIIILYDFFDIIWKAKS